MQPIKFVAHIGYNEATGEVGMSFGNIMVNMITMTPSEALELSEQLAENARIVLKGKNQSPVNAVDGWIKKATGEDSMKMILELWALLFKVMEISSVPNYAAEGHKTLEDLGMDSLSCTELKLRLEYEYKFDWVDKASQIELSDTTASLAKKLIAQLEKKELKS